VRSGRSIAKRRAYIIFCLNNCPSAERCGLLLRVLWSWGVDTIPRLPRVRSIPLFFLAVFISPLRTCNPPMLGQTDPSAVQEIENCLSDGQFLG